MFVYIYIHINMSIRIYIYIYTHIYIYIYIERERDICVCIYLSLSLYIYIYIHTPKTTTMVIPNLHLEHHTFLKMIYHCRNHKPSPLPNPTLLPSPSSYYIVTYTNIVRHTIPYYNIHYHIDYAIMFMI